MASADPSLCQAIEETDQLQKRQRLYRVLAVTLPFEQKDVSQTLFERAINQTQKRWAWFMESRELDTERGTDLGTLGYLPWEIRQQILKMVKDRHFHWESYQIPERDSDIFDLYYFDLPRMLNYAACCLQLSSATLGFEYDDLLFSNTVFEFNSSTALEEFLGQLSDFHQTKIRRIIVTIRVPCGCASRLWNGERDGWKTACFQLPTSLRQVSFDLDHTRLSTHSRICKTRGDSRRSNEIRATANLVEVLSKMIVRSAPDAVIEMHESARKGLLPEELAPFDAAVNDVER